MADGMASVREIDAAEIARVICELRMEIGG